MPDRLPRNVFFIRDRFKGPTPHPGPALPLDETDPLATEVITLRKAVAVTGRPAADLFARWIADYGERIAVRPRRDATARTHKFIHVRDGSAVLVRSEVTFVTVRPGTLESANLAFGWTNSLPPYDARLGRVRRPRGWRRRLAALAAREGAGHA
jgi:hypothetical protein